MTEQGEQIIELGRQRKTYKDALEDLVQHIESVFHQDWAHTLSCFKEIEWWVAPDETFLATRKTIEQDGNNWGNRGSLLASYCRAVQVLGKSPAKLSDSWINRCKPSSTLFAELCSPRTPNS